MRSHTHSYNFGVASKGKGKMIKKAKPKPPRNKAMVQLHMLDHQLRCSTGQGFMRYVLSEEERKNIPPEKWCKLSTCCDEASENIAMAKWLMTSKYKVNAVVRPDNAHIGWNDGKTTLRAENLWGHGIHSMIAASLDKRPFNSYQYFEVRLKVMEEHFEVQVPENCSIFCEQDSNIVADDVHCEQFQANTDLATVWSVFKSNKELLRRGSDGSLTRWFEVWDTIEKRLKHWHQLKVVYTLLALEIGLLKPKGYQKIADVIMKMNAKINAQANLVPEDQEDQSAVKQGKRQVQQSQRQLLNSAVLMTYSFFADETNWRLDHIICGLLKHLRQFHGENLVELTSVQATKDWVVQGLNHNQHQTRVNFTLDVLSNRAELEAMQFRFKACKHELEMDQGVHLTVKLEDHFAGLLARSCITLAGRRMKRLVCTQAHYPHKFSLT